MITIEPAVVVEGTYDKIRLSSLLDTLILTTDGFRIFKDKEKLELIGCLAKTRGVLILTDSDHAGFLIRNRLKQAIAEGRVYHGYIPDIYGKEKRKAHPSAEGKLGVEAMPTQVLAKVLADAGVLETTPKENRNPLTKADLFVLGLSGTPNATQKRKQLLTLLQLPEAMTTNTLLEVLNKLYTKDEIEKLCQEL